MTTPDYFALSFWRATLNHVLFGAATNAMNAWIWGGIGAADSDTHLSIPGWAVASAALTGAILALLLSILGQTLTSNRTPPASFIPAAPKAVAKKTARRRPRKKAPTTADLKQTDAAHGGE